MNICVVIILYILCGFYFIIKKYKNALNMVLEKEKDKKNTKYNSRVEISLILDSNKKTYQISYDLGEIIFLLIAWPFIISQKKHSL